MLPPNSKSLVIIILYATSTFITFNLNRECTSMYTYSRLPTRMKEANVFKMPKNRRKLNFLILLEKQHKRSLYLDIVTCMFFQIGEETDVILIPGICVNELFNCTKTLARLWRMFHILKLLAYYCCSFVLEKYANIKK